MNDDVKCPYCLKDQEINHDDGVGYTEDELHEQECSDCEKIFTFLTHISFFYDAYKADCLNGGEHKYEATHAFPKECTKMVCVDCDDRRKPTEDEMKTILAGREEQ